MYANGTMPRREGAQSTLESYIERACSPMLNQPNLSLNLEIADYVNAKKANTPREAAFTTLQYVNRRNTHIAMLGLSLLDILVKNCGYPFHLQIATKDFLNELVRRFPEKPPVFPPPPMQKILELVHEWKLTICTTSKYKEDLVHIRDMHRLLSYKGYRFPDIDRRAASVLNETDRLKSAEELEEEDRAAQAAKLQELIRRGTPKDLAAAQELMKIMSGAEPDKQIDYEAQMQKELDRVQSRVLLLNELLNNAKPGEKFVEGDAFDQIGQKCKQVQPKLQKWISEAAENKPEAMDRLLLINDLINNVLKRYASFQGGDFSATAEIDPAFAGKDTATAKSRAKEVSLIDFDDPVESSTPPISTSASGGLDDLGFGSLSLGPTASSSSTAQGGLPLGLFDSAPAPSAPQINRPGQPSLSISAADYQRPLPHTGATPTSSGSGTFWATANSGSQRAGGGAMNDLWATAGAGGTATPTLGAVALSANPASRSATPLGGPMGAGRSPMQPGAMANGGAAQRPPQTQAPAPPAKKDPFADLEGLF